MNKKQKLEKLTWEFFWQQKIKEIVIAIFIIIGLIFIPTLLGNLGISLWGDEFVCGIPSPENACEVNSVNTWWAGLVVLVVLAIAITILYFLGTLWLTSNWDKATERAKKKLEAKSND